MATKRASAPKKKASTKKPSKPAPAATPQPEGSKPEPSNTVPFEIDPKRVEESLLKLRETLTKWANKGRYSKVRFKFRGRQLLPDMPLAAVLAVQGVTFYWTGLLRALIFNIAGQTVLDVEIVNDSEKELAQGKEKLLSGDLDEALEHFGRAKEMDHDNPTVHLNLGIALKLKGQLEAARAALELSSKLGGEGQVGVEARRLLETLPRQNQSGAV